MSDLTPEVVEELKRRRETVLGREVSFTGMDAQSFAYLLALNDAAESLIRAAEENAQLRAGNEMLSAANEAFSRDAAQLRARLAKAKTALEKIAGGFYSSAITSDAALQAALASPQGRADWKEKCIGELQKMANDALADYSAKETE